MGAISQDAVWLLQVGRDHFQPKRAHMGVSMATGGRRMKTDKQMHGATSEESSLPHILE